MQIVKRLLTSVLLIAAFSVPVVTTGCTDHDHYRAYDPYYRDYHRWPDEDGYYRRWYGENYHDREYRDYRRLNHEEQKRYWDWRHSHDHDHDHDRDHH